MIFGSDDAPQQLGFKPFNRFAQFKSFKE